MAGSPPGLAARERFLPLSPASAANASTHTRSRRSRSSEASESSKCLPSAIIRGPIPLDPWSPSSVEAPRREPACKTGLSSRTAGSFHPKSLMPRTSYQACSLAVRFYPASIGMGCIPDESGQAGRPRVVIGAESLVADVHLRQTTVDLIAAVVEPAADVPAMRLCC